MFVIWIFLCRVLWLVLSHRLMTSQWRSVTVGNHQQLLVNVSPGYYQQTEETDGTRPELSPQGAVDGTQLFGLLTLAHVRHGVGCLGILNTQGGGAVSNTTNIRNHLWLYHRQSSTEWRGSVSTVTSHHQHPSSNVLMFLKMPCSSALSKTKTFQQTWRNDTTLVLGSGACDVYGQSTLRCAALTLFEASC